MGVPILDLTKKSISCSDKSFSISLEFMFIRQPLSELSLGLEEAGGARCQESKLCH